MAIEKIKILGAVLALPAKQHCKSSLFGHFCGNWAGLVMLFSWKLKKAPRILIFSIVMGDDYSFDVKNIEIWVPAFISIIIHL